MTTMNTIEEVQALDAGTALTVAEPGGGNRLWHTTADGVRQGDVDVPWHVFAEVVEAGTVTIGIAPEVGHLLTYTGGADYTDIVMEIQQDEEGNRSLIVRRFRRFDMQETPVTIHLNQNRGMYPYLNFRLVPESEWTDAQRVMHSTAARTHAHLHTIHTLQSETVSPQQAESLRTQVANARNDRNQLMTRVQEALHEYVREHEIDEGEDSLMDSLFEAARAEWPTPDEHTFTATVQFTFTGIPTGNGRSGSPSADWARSSIRGLDDVSLDGDWDDVNVEVEIEQVTDPE